MPMPPSPMPSSSPVRVKAGLMMIRSRRDVFALIIINPTFTLPSLTIGHAHAHHAPLISPLTPLPSLDHPCIPCPRHPPHLRPHPHHCPHSRPFHLLHLAPCPPPLNHLPSLPSPTITPSPGEDDVGGDGDDRDDGAGMTSHAWWCVWNAWGWVLHEDEVGPAIS